MESHSFFHDSTCMISQTDWRCFISFAFIKNVYWRQDLRHDHDFINLIIFSLHSNQPIVFAESFYWYIFFWLALLGPTTFFWLFVLPHPNKIQEEKRAKAEKNCSNEMCLPVTMDSMQSRCVGGAMVWWVGKHSISIQLPDIFVTVNGYLVMKISVCLNTETIGGSQTHANTTQRNHLNRR